MRTFFVEYILFSYNCLNSTYQVFLIFIIFIQMYKCNLSGTSRMYPKQLNAVVFLHNIKNMPKIVVKLNENNIKLIFYFIKYLYLN